MYALALYYFLMLRLFSDLEIAVSVCPDHLVQVENSALKKLLFLFCSIYVEILFILKLKLTAFFMKKYFSTLERSFLALDWDPDLKKRYFDENAAEVSPHSFWAIFAFFT